MKPLLSIKTLFRTPFKTILTFVLLASVTFALFSRVAEHTITGREIKNAAKEYRGVGSAEIGPAHESYLIHSTYIYADPRVALSKEQNISEKGQKYYLDELRYQPLSREQIGFILKLPYITGSDTRYMTAGISDRYYRMDEGEEYYNYAARYVIEGTLLDIQYSTYYNKIMLDDCTLLAGDPSCLPKDKEIAIRARSKKNEPGVFNGGGGPIDRLAIEYDDSYKYDTEYVKNLTIGDRYVFVGRYGPPDDSMRFFLSDLLTDSWCEAVWPVEGQSRNYLETERFKPIRELIELTNSDAHTFDVVYTEDMDSIMRFAEGDMAITDGRGLTREDSADKANVCVVSEQFATANKLGVGDKLSLKLGTEFFEQYKSLGAVAAARERYKPAEKAVELEIAGIYADTDRKQDQLRKPHWGYSINTVFVPESLLPVDESTLNDHVFSPSEFSFTVDDAWSIPAFMESMEKAAPAFEEEGFKLIFYDDGWPAVAEAYKMSERLSVITILLSTAAVAVATGFIVFLYIGRKKKEYAVMRALGTTRKDSARALLLPLMAMALFAVLLGSCAAWLYTAGTVAKNDVFTAMKDYTVDTSVPFPVAAGCILGEILLVLLFAAFGLRRIGAVPPLMLLQDNQNGARRRKHDRNKQIYDNEQVHNNKQIHSDEQTSCDKKAHSNEAQGNNNPAYSEVNAVPESVPDTHIPDAKVLNAHASGVPRMAGRKKAKRVWSHVLRYISKHLYRSAGKSVLSVLLSALLIGAVGQFEIMRQSYVDLCRGTKITAKFVGGLSVYAVMQMEEMGYAADPYYEYTGNVDFNYIPANLAMTNDIGRYMAEEPEIAYAEGYDESCMKEPGEVCVAGRAVLEETGLKPGDSVHVTPPSELKFIQSRYIGSHKARHPDEAITDEEILELYRDKINREIMNEGLIYTIAGSVTTPSGKYDEMIFIPGTLSTRRIFGFEASLDLAEFTLADNLRADEFRAYAEKMTGGSGEYTSGGIAFVMDTDKIENLLNTLRLMEKLFPVVIAAAVLIGGLLCGLIIIQSSKEAAVLRVLGTTRRRTCAILMLEQMFLCVVGLAVGAFGLWLYQGKAVATVAPGLYLFAALYFAGCLAGSWICSAAATRRSVLELLQMKE